MFSRKPYIEGAWMNKFNGKYYLQYACPGTQYNIYADGVYVGDSPLGPFTLAKIILIPTTGRIHPRRRPWLNDERH